MEKTMKESILSIAQWHAETFPDATLLQQNLKFKEELGEWIASTHVTDQGLILGDMLELADMFIVACGISRFAHVDAMFSFRTVASQMEHTHHTSKDLEKAIDAKMEINRARTWNNNNGYYKHKDN